MVGPSLFRNPRNVIANPISRSCHSPRFDSFLSFATSCHLLFHFWFFSTKTEGGEGKEMSGEHFPCFKKFFGSPFLGFWFFPELFCFLNRNMTRGTLPFAFTEHFLASKNFIHSSLSPFSIFLRIQSPSLTVSWGKDKGHELASFSLSPSLTFCNHSSLHFLSPVHVALSLFTPFHVPSYTFPIRSMVDKRRMLTKKYVSGCNISLSSSKLGDGTIPLFISEKLSFVHFFTFLWPVFLHHLFRPSISFLLSQEKISF